MNKWWENCLKNHGIPYGRITPPDPGGATNRMILQGNFFQKQGLVYYGQAMFEEMRGYADAASFSDWIKTGRFFFCWTSWDARGYPG